MYIKLFEKYENLFSIKKKKFERKKLRFNIYQTKMNLRIKPFKS